MEARKIELQAELKKINETQEGQKDKIPMTLDSKCKLLDKMDARDNETLRLMNQTEASKNQSSNTN